MAEKNKKANIGIIIIAVIIVIAVGFGIYKMLQGNNIAGAKKSADIVISESDSKEVKIQKLQKKLELVNKEIEKVEAESAPELEKINKLYEEYVGVMNEFQTSIPEENVVSEEVNVEEPTEENAETTENAE